MDMLLLGDLFYDLGSFMAYPCRWSRHVCIWSHRGWRCCTLLLNGLLPRCKCPTPQKPDRESDMSYRLSEMRWSVSSLCAMSSLWWFCSPSPPGLKPWASKVFTSSFLSSALWCSFSLRYCLFGVRREGWRPGTLI